MSGDRTGCCADWPKPCSYHQGWQDAMDAVGALAPRSPSGYVAVAGQCEALIQAGSRCTNPAHWTRDGRYVCGLHQFTASRYVDPSP